MTETPDRFPEEAIEANSAGRYEGEVAYLYAYDVAHEMKRGPLTTLLGQPVEPFGPGVSRRTPREAFFYRPGTVHLPPLERVGPHGPVRVERTVKLFPVGAVSILVRVSFNVEKIDDLVEYHDLKFADGSLEDDVKRLAEEIRAQIAPYCIRPVPQLRPEEAYTVFCLRSPLRTGTGGTLRAEDWLLVHRRKIAALLTQETDADHLSDQEADESTGLYLSYYENDLSVIDWDAALLVEEPGNFDEILYVMELANVQLAELEAYDSLLDEAVERSYRDVGPGKWRPRNEILASLREIQIDLARLSDELSNITKFFGDWHLARIYKNLSARFHLADWQRVIDEKLKTLGDLYHLVRTDQMNRIMLILEITIVLLFIIDLFILVASLKPPA